MELTFQQKINNLSWLIAAFEERLSYLYKEAFPLYAYLDIVFSSQFCNAEHNWKLTKQILSAIKNKIRQVLKNGVMNPLVFKQALLPYSKRLNIISVQTIDQLNEFISFKNNVGPKSLFVIANIQKELINLSLDILNCIDSLKTQN